MKSRANKILRISIVMFVSTFLVQIVVCNHMAVKTSELNNISAQVVSLQNQISVINQEIYMASSIVGMEQKAKDQGFALMEVSVKNITSPTIARAI